MQSQWVTRHGVILSFLVHPWTRRLEVCRLLLVHRSDGTRKLPWQPSELEELGKRHGGNGRSAHMPASAIPVPQSAGRDEAIPPTAISQACPLTSYWSLALSRQVDFDPPSPSPKRFMDLGAATARALRDSPFRVALLASSSWSHAFLVEA